MRGLFEYCCGDTRLWHYVLRTTQHLFILLLLLFLSACNGATPTPPPSATPAPTPEPSPTLAHTPTPLPQRLVVCTTEPRAASPFVPSQAGSDLLALFYEEPVERVAYQWEPRLVTHLPTLERGDVDTLLAPVTPGTRYVDALGTVHLYEGEETLFLPQMLVTFTLQSGLRWSDGTPLTSRDAVLGYHLAQSDPAQGRWRQLAERTARFVAVDEQTLRWEGLPGYLSAEYPGFLFPLQPAHRWRGQALEDILQDRTPPATGPFKITSWEAGREIRLTRNPHYSGTPPTLQEIVLRFPGQAPGQWPGLLVSGVCDVALPDPVILSDWREWVQLGLDGEALIYADAAPITLRLDFNLSPAEGQSPVEALPVRQGIAHCLNREALTEALPNEALFVAHGFIPPGHPAYDLDVTTIPYDSLEGQALLRGAGWRDADGDGVREAHDVPGFSDGEPLSLTLHLAAPYFVTAAYLAADLEACGMGVTVQPHNVGTFYTPGPDSPLFSRTYDMALLGWQAELPQVCGAWLSERIPSADNEGQGENFSGYTSDRYDAVCTQALTAVNAEEQHAALQEAQGLLNEALPSLFLTWRPFWFAARPQVQGLQADASAYGTLWNSEDIYLEAVDGRQ